MPGEMQEQHFKENFPSIDFKLFELFCLFAVNVFFVSLESWKKKRGNGDPHYISLPHIRPKEA